MTTHAASNVWKRLQLLYLYSHLSHHIDDMGI